MTNATNPIRKGPPKHRAPKGVDSLRRVNLPLMPEERAELERRATLDGRTCSAMARIYVIRGMAADAALANAEPADTPKTA